MQHQHADFDRLAAAAAKLNAEDDAEYQARLADCNEQAANEREMLKIHSGGTTEGVCPHAAGRSHDENGVRIL